jgi:DNA-directed RNA polymerase subunit RPC12/RpoP
MIKPPFELKDIKPGEFTYFSRRKLANKTGEVSGEIFVWKRNKDIEHNFVLECPYCSSESDGNIELKKRPYRIKCSHCGRTITLKKLKDAK